MKRSDFDVEILRLHGLKKEIDPDMKEAYWMALKSVTLTEFNYCITKILQEDRLFPKIPRFERLLELRRKGSSPMNINGSHLQSFHCTVCDVDFSVVFGSNETRIISCEGSGKSNCGRTWTLGVLKTKLIDSAERQQDSIQL